MMKCLSVDIQIIDWRFLHMSLSFQNYDVSLDFNLARQHLPFGKRIYYYFSSCNQIIDKKLQRILVTKSIQFHINKQLMPKLRYKIIFSIIKENKIERGLNPNSPDNSSSILEWKLMGTNSAGCNAISIVNRSPIKKKPPKTAFFFNLPCCIPITYGLGS